MLNELKRRILHFMYPNRCPCCEKVIGFNDDFCTECKSAITLYNGSFEIDGCDEFYAVCVYNDAIKPAVFLLKDGVCGNAAFAFAKGMAELLRNCVDISALDYIVAVPMHKNKCRKRGYNQAALIAVELSRLISVPYAAKAIVKVRDTSEQKLLSGIQRKENLIDAFAASKESIKGKRILLIDDICTTGSTLKETADCLKNAGAVSVIAITFCKTEK